MWHFEAGSDMFWERACKGICYVRIVIYEIERFPIRFLMIDRKINSEMTDNRHSLYLVCSLRSYKLHHTSIDFGCLYCVILSRYEK